jgi:hypothetical protein
MCSEPVIRAPFSGWRRAEFFAQRHQARHFGFGDGDFGAAKFGQADIGDASTYGRIQSDYSRR